MRPVVHLTPLVFGVDGAIGGGERYPMELAAAMAELTPTVLVGFGSSRHSFRHGALRVEVLPARVRWAGSEVNPLGERLFGALGRCRVLHIHQWESVLANVAAVHGRAVGARVVATDHGGWGRNYARKFRLHRLVHGFAAVSDFSASFYPEFADRAVTVHGGVDVGRFRPAEPDRRVDRAVFVGRLLPHKGVAELIQALPRGVALHVVGRPRDPEYRDRLHDLARGRRVTFDEQADDEAVLEACRTSRVLVLPSLDPQDGLRHRTELLGLTLLEGMACGTPAICTQTGGMPEVIGGSGAGTVVPQRDPVALGAALRRWSTGGPEWEAASRAARRRVVEDFTWDRVAARCLELYG